MVKPKSRDELWDKMLGDEEVEVKFIRKRKRDLREKINSDTLIWVLTLLATFSLIQILFNLIQGYGYLLGCLLWLMFGFTFSFAVWLIVSLFTSKYREVEVKK